jgi:hypothetical protein
VPENQSDKELLLGKEFLDGYSGKGSGTNTYQVLKRIFEFACSEKAFKDESGYLVFSWQDLRTSNDIEDDGKWLKKYLKKGLEEWPAHYEMLNQLAADQKLEHYPIFSLAEEGGGSGNVTKYRIEHCPVSQDKALDKSSLREGYISYTSERSDTNNPIIRFVDGLTAKGLKLHLMFGTMMAGIVTGLLVLLGGLYLLTNQTTTFGLINTAFDIALIIGAIYMCFSPIYFCITNRIIIAPTMLSPLDHFSTQLEYSPTEEIRKNGSPIRQFRIVSYVGECLICGGRVDVEKGKGAMSGRLVGKCSNSPVEHQYSFDHKTRVGRLINDEYIAIKAPE